jgi:hypothetical protein
MPTETLARWLIYAGVGLVGLGLLVWVLGRFLDLGNLPGDIAYRGENVRIFAPITTMIIISIVLTVLLNLIIRWLR